ncbi:hypothetical protein GGF31_007051 [Allomyces arbusculus]|nr:hypothetical protein GGF31_007051 [Allomyces arbusculus]
MAHPRRALPATALPTTPLVSPPPRKSARRRVIRAVLDGIVYLTLASVGFGALFAVLSPLARLETKPTTAMEPSGAIDPSIGEQSALYHQSFDLERRRSDGVLWASDTCVVPALASRIAELPVAHAIDTAAEPGLEKGVENVANVAHDGDTSTLIFEQFTDVNEYAYRMATARVFVVLVEECAVPLVADVKVAVPPLVGGLEEADSPPMSVVPDAEINVDSSPPSVALGAESLPLADVVAAIEVAENESQPPTSTHSLDRNDPVANYPVAESTPEDPFAATLAQWEEEAVCAGDFDWRGMANVPESLDIRPDDYSKPAQDYFSMIGTAIRAGSRWIFPVRWADAGADTLVHISDRSQALRVLDVLSDFPGRILPMRAFPELGTHRGGERFVYPDDLLVATIPYRMALPYDMMDEREEYTLWSLQALTPRERDVAIFQLLDTALPVIAHLVDAGITHGRVPMVLVHPRDEADAGAVHPGWSPFRVALVEPVAEGEGYSLWTSLLVHTLMPLLSDRWFNKDWDAAFPLDESLRSKVFADATNGVDAPELKAVLAQLAATDVPDPARLWPAWDAAVRAFYPILVGMAQDDADDCNDVTATYYDRLLALSQRDTPRDVRLTDTSVITSSAPVNPYLKPLDRSLFPPSLATSIASATNTAGDDTTPPSDPDLICSARAIQRFWDNISTPLDESYESPFTCSVRDRLVARLDSNRVITLGDVTPGDSKYLRLRMRDYYRAPRGWILRIERMRKVDGGRKKAGVGL